MTVAALALDGGSAGSIAIAGFGTRVARATLVVTIADQPGVEVPYAYAATVN